MPQRKRQPFDSTGLGFLLGVLVPLLIFIGVYFFGERDMPFSHYVNNLWHIHALMKLASLCVFANLLVFMGFIRLKYDQSARGVLGATIIYGVAIIISRAF